MSVTPGTKIKILIAESSITIQKIVELTFADDSYEVMVADNGNRAISLAKARRPDIVLCAVILPVPNGYEVTQALKADEATRAIPVILLHGTFEPFDKKRAKQVGADDWIRKPFSSPKLIELVRARTGGAPIPEIDPDFPEDGGAQSGFSRFLKRIFGFRE